MTQVFSAAAVTPNIAPPIHIDSGDLLDQIIAHWEPFLEAAAEAGVDLLAASIPGGSLFAYFGKKMVSQFVASAAVTLEGWLKGQSVDINPRNAFESAVLQAIKLQLPRVEAFFDGDQLSGWISAEVGKISWLQPKPLNPSGAIGV